MANRPRSIVESDAESRAEDHESGGGVGDPGKLDPGRPEQDNVTPLRTRLVVELSRNSAQLLDELTRIEDLNKTTIVNRAIQVYSMLRLAQENGGEFHMSEASGEPLHRVRFI